MSPVRIPFSEPTATGPLLTWPHKHVCLCQLLCRFASFNDHMSCFIHSFGISFIVSMVSSIKVCAETKVFAFPPWFSHCLWESPRPSLLSFPGCRIPGTGWPGISTSDPGQERSSCPSTVSNTPGRCPFTSQNLHHAGFSKDTSQQTLDEQMKEKQARSKSWLHSWTQFQVCERVQCSIGPESLDSSFLCLFFREEKGSKMVITHSPRARHFTNHTSVPSLHYTTFRGKNWGSER